MKKAFPYIIGGLVVVAILLLAFSLSGTKRKRKLNERITFSRKDKIPYGTYVAFQNLKYIFPDATIKTNRLSPEKWWNVDSVKEGGQAIVIITPQFIANETEMDLLIAFAQKGNNVFISTRTLSYEAQQMLHCNAPNGDYMFYANADNPGYDDTLNISLVNPPFAHMHDFAYPGRKFENHFYKYDTAFVGILGTNKNRDKNFIQLKTGKGNIFLHTAPMAFTNYFLLHKQNAAYYDEVLSLIPKDITRITWDEYFLYKLFEKKNSRGWLAVLFKYPPFKWGLLAAFFTICLYVLIEMRRKQRVIPFTAKPKNDSLDFVKTIGRLYYEKNDHRDLAKKMGLYFLDHVRNTYKLATGTLDDNFIKNLHFKSGYNESRLRKIVSFVNFVDDAPGITDAQLAEFHEDLEDFYRR